MKRKWTDIELGNKWRGFITKRIGFVKSKATTAKSIIAPGVISEIGHTCYHSINEIVKSHEIPPEMVSIRSKYKVPKEFHVTQTLSHWANEKTSIAFREHALILYIETQREELNSNSRLLLISDVLKGQWTNQGNCLMIQR